MTITIAPADKTQATAPAEFFAQHVVRNRFSVLPAAYWEIIRTDDGNIYPLNAQQGKFFYSYIPEIIDGNLVLNEPIGEKYKLRKTAFGQLANNFKLLRRQKIAYDTLAQLHFDINQNPQQAAQLDNIRMDATRDLIEAEIVHTMTQCISELAAGLANKQEQPHQFAETIALKFINAYLPLNENDEFIWQQRYNTPADLYQINHDNSETGEFTTIKTKCHEWSAENLSHETTPDEFIAGVLLPAVPSLAAAVSVNITVTEGILLRTETDGAHIIANNAELTAEITKQRTQGENSYEWQTRQNSNEEWTSIPNANTNIFTIPQNSSDGNEFRLRISGLRNIANQEILAFFSDTFRIGA